MALRRLLLLGILLLPLMAAARVVPVTYLTRDSLPYWFNGEWLFAAGDGQERAGLQYNDTGWKPISSLLYLNTPEQYKRVAGISWFRLHLHVDSTIAGKPMGLRISQEGASEVYLDGRLVETFGRVAPRDSSERFDPQRVPVILTFDSAGSHVLAVRYANYPALRERRIYHKTPAGFLMSINYANNAIYDTVQSAWSSTFAITLMFGIFLTLGMVHLLLYGFRRADRSNLFFSIFNLGLAACLFTGWLVNSSHSPGPRNLMIFLLIGIFGIAMLALSGFVNILFSKSRKRFYALAIVCLIVTVLRFFSFGAALIGLTFFAFVVVIEAIVLIISAMIKKVKGARILGAGMLLFLFFFAYFIITVVITDGFEFESGTAAANIVQVVGILAIISLPVSISAYLAWRFSAINKDLSVQLAQVQQLSQRAMEQELEKQRLLETRQEELEREVAARTIEVREQHEALKTEKQKTDDLLLNILPAEVADELKERGAAKARLYNEVSVLFTDFVNFTGISERLSPEELVAELDFCFREFDAIITRFGLEKIKTIGDAYLAVSGLPVHNPRHATDTVQAALAILEFMKQRKAAQANAFDIRLGIHSGPVVAGIVGIKKFAYDIWGDTVNTAARMEQHSEAGRINISDATYRLVREAFHCMDRGVLEAKNKGRMSMYFVTGPNLDVQLPE